MVQKSLYVDDGLTGASSVSGAIELQKELQELFNKGGFLLRKWKSNEPEALRHLPEHLVEQKTTKELPVASELTKVLENQLEHGVRLAAPHNEHHFDRASPH